MTVSYMGLMRAQQQPLYRPQVDTEGYTRLSAVVKLSEARERLGMERLKDVVLKPIPAAGKKVRNRKRDLTFTPRDTKDYTPQKLIDNEKWKEIINQVAFKYGMSIEIMTSGRRDKQIVAARREASYRMLMETKMSYPAIARRLGFKDHTSVMHAVRVYAALNGLYIRGTVVIDGFKERNAEIVKMAYFDKVPVHRICKKFGLSEDRVRSIVAHAGYKVRKNYAVKVEE